jgi:hypothetical protein
MHERHQTELRQEMQQRRQNRRNNAPPSDLPEKQRKETQAKMDELLTKEQKARLSQIALQLQGPAVLLTADMQKQLGVTQEQNLRIAQIQADRDVRLKELQAGIAARQIRPQDIQSQMDQIQKDTSAMITEMLTEEQSAQLQKIFGRPFKVGG